MGRPRIVFVFFFFFNDTATTEIYTLSLHDALPISRSLQGVRRRPRRRARRARSGVLHEPGARAALPEGREAACAGRDDPRALGGRAGAAHDRRGGLAGL